MSGPCSLVAVELCLLLAPGSPARTRLHQIVAQHPAASTPGAKWQMLTEASNILMGNLHLAVRGCWDFFDDHERAMRDFDMWSKGMMTREGCRPGPSAESAYRGGEPLHFTFTIAVLMRRGVASERTLAARLSVGEPLLWHRTTFARVLGSLSGISYASVRGDVMYLIPGDEAWGLTASDLQQPKFHYLRPIVG